MSPAIIIVPISFRFPSLLNADDARAPHIRAIRARPRPARTRRRNRMEITNIEPFLRYYENIRSRTVRVIHCIPADQLEWRPRPDAFSFGDLIRHLGAI